MHHTNFRNTGSEPWEHEPSEEAQRLQQAVNALKVTSGLSAWAVTYGPLVVMEAVSDWLAYMHNQVAHIDGEVANG